MSGPCVLRHLLDPREELLRVERADAQRHAGDARRLDVVVMVVMVVVVIMIVVVMVVIMIVVVSVEELRIERQDAVEIEGAAIEHAVERNRAALGAVDGRVRIDGADARLDRFSSSGETRSVLLSRITSAKPICSCASGLSLERAEKMLGVGDGDDRVELGLGAHVVVHEEGLRHRRRVGEAGGLDQDAVEAAGPLHQPLDDVDEVAAHGAADAAVVHLEHFLVGLDDEVVVDADLAELVDDDRVLLAVVLGEDAVEQRRLAGAEVAGEHGDGDLGFGFGLGLRHEGLRKGGWTGR